MAKELTEEQVRPFLEDIMAVYEKHGLAFNLYNFYDGEDSNYQIIVEELDEYNKAILNQFGLISHSGPFYKRYYLY